MTVHDNLERKGKRSIVSLSLMARFKFSELFQYFVFWFLLYIIKNICLKNQNPHSYRSSFIAIMSAPDLDRYYSLSFDATVF